LGDLRFGIYDLRGLGHEFHELARIKTRLRLGGKLKAEMERENSREKAQKTQKGLKVEVHFCAFCAF
jgi:hypothetical protein